MYRGSLQASSFLFVWVEFLTHCVVVVASSNCGDAIPDGYTTQDIYRYDFHDVNFHSSETVYPLPCHSKASSCSEVYNS